MTNITLRCFEAVSWRKDTLFGFEFLCHVKLLIMSRLLVWKSLTPPVTAVLEPATLGAEAGLPSGAGILV